MNDLMAFMWMKDAEPAAQAALGMTAVGTGSAPTAGYMCSIIT